MVTIIHQGGYGYAGTSNLSKEGIMDAVVYQGEEEDELPDFDDAGLAAGPDRQDRGQGHEHQGHEGHERNEEGWNV